MWKVSAYVNSGTDVLETSWTVPIRETGVHGAQGNAGANGADGSTKFKSFVYTGSETAPSTPIGGSSVSPVPTTAGWTDTVPAGTLPLWMSTRFFSNKSGESDSAWSTPIIPIDNDLTDFEWSDPTSNNPGTPSSPLNGAIWKNDPQELTGDVVFMAIRYRASLTIPWDDNSWVVSKEYKDNIKQELDLIRQKKKLTEEEIANNAKLLSGKVQMTDYVSSEVASSSSSKILPVEGGRISSVFGDPRDGGRRKHLG